MKNNCLIFRILFIFLFILLSSLFFINLESFAFSFSYDGIDYDIDLPSDFDIDSNPNFIIMRNTDIIEHDLQLAFPASDYESPFYYYESSSISGIRYYKQNTTDYGQWNYFNYYPDTGWSSMKTTYGYTCVYYGSDKDGQEGYCIYSTMDVYDSSGELFFEGTSLDEEIIYPAIANTPEDLATGTFDYIYVSPGTFSNTEILDLYIFNVTDIEEDTDIFGTLTPLFSSSLSSSSNYYKSVTVGDTTEFWYEITRSSMGVNFKNENRYLFVLTLGGSPIQEIYATIGGLSEEDILNNNFDMLQATITQTNKELQDSIDKQTEVIEENNKTNKNIFEKIGEILSYLNPFSENFFAYKLVELIVDGLKSLFIPSDNFFSTYFDELNNWFSDRLGFLYYPLELLFDLLDRFLSIDFAEPVINIPDIKEPFTKVTLIKSVSFNFNDLLENETLKNVHDIYFIIVDAVIYIGLVTLLYKKYEEVMTK